MSLTTESSRNPSNVVFRWAEFTTLFVLVPVAIAVVFPPSMMFSLLFAFTALGMLLLHFTDGFHWSSLFEGLGGISWRVVFVVAVVTAITCYAVLSWQKPEALFFLFGPDAPRMANGWSVIWVIALFYPLVSALPQELVFRPLFFRRYGMLLPEGRVRLALNAGIFSLAHLMYWSWIVAVMTFFGGLVFAWSYEARKNFPEAVVLHSIAGVLLFAVGMGAYFYSGNVVRPF